jgi:hypothetical protein
MIQVASKMKPFACVQVTLEVPCMCFKLPAAKPKGFFHGEAMPTPTSNSGDVVNFAIPSGYYSACAENSYARSPTICCVMTLELAQGLERVVELACACSSCTPYHHGS